MFFNILTIIGFIFSSISITIAIVYYNRTKPNLIIKMANQSYFYKDGDDYLAHLFITITNDCTIPDSILTINAITDAPESNNALYLLPDFSYHGKQYYQNMMSISKNELIVTPSFKEVTFPLKLEPYETINICLCIPNWHLIADNSFYLLISTSRKTHVKHNSLFSINEVELLIY